MTETPERQPYYRFMAELNSLLAANAYGSETARLRALGETTYLQVATSTDAENHENARLAGLKAAGVL